MEINEYNIDKLIENIVYDQVPSPNDAGPNEQVEEVKVEEPLVEEVAQPHIEVVSQEPIIE